MVRRVLLPQRYHGHPAPVPRLAATQGITALAAEVIMTRMVGPRRRFLIFTPTVALCHESRAELAGRLAKGLADRGEGPVEVGAVEAASPDRDQLVEEFLRGRLPVLLATSVLERGVTFPALDVLVLYADHPVFDRVSLLQMAGRAGRTADDPHGEVWFLAREISPEMAAARQWTEALNEAAG
jgi:competence protein ComFA